MTSKTLRKLDEASSTLEETTFWKGLNPEQKGVAAFAVALWSLPERDQELCWQTLDLKATLHEEGATPKELLAFDEAQSLEVKAALSRLHDRRLANEAEIRRHGKLTLPYDNPPS